jgi:hypothetical protein
MWADRTVSGGKTMAASRPSLPALLLLAGVHAYRMSLSLLIGGYCRYQPTCSLYAAEAIRRHGARRGAFMAVARLCRCHPWGRSGADPVPEIVTTPAWAPWRAGDWAWKQAADAPQCEELKQ